MSRSNNRKYMAKVLGDTMKTEAHAHALCSALQLALCYKSLALEKRKVQASTMKDSKKLESQVHRTETVQKLPVIGVENSSLQYTFSVGNYQQTAAAKHAAHTFVVEMANHVW